MKEEDNNKDTNKNQDTEGKNPPKNEEKLKSKSF